MKQLDEFKEIIHNCSKCGLCQSVCPTYIESGNECVVSRGQFIMLRGVIKGDLKMNKNINKYLDLCLKCGKCSNFCPSNIDIVEVILSAKAEYFKSSFEGKILSFLHSKMVFNTALNIANFFFGSKKKYNKKCKTKAIYYGGCSSKVFSKTSDYIKSTLNNMEIEVLDTDLNCCGLPFLTSGNADRFIEQLNENVNKIKDLEFDFFITDCASCQSTWASYAKYIKDPILREKLENIKFKTIYDLIAENDIQFKSNKETTITYHQPCHSKNDVAEKIISKIKNIKYIELKKKDDCCGFSGLIKPTTWRTTKNISTKKHTNIINTKAKYVLTTCFACFLTLNILSKFKYRTKTLISFLSENCRVL